MDGDPEAEGNLTDDDSSFMNLSINTSDEHYDGTNRVNFLRGLSATS